MRQRTDLVTSMDDRSPLGRPMQSAGPDMADMRQSSQINLLQILWRRQFTVWMTMLLCIVGALIYLALATPIFTASSRLYVQQQGPQMLSTDAVGMLSKNDAYLYTQAELIKSFPVLNKAIDRSGAKGMRQFAEVDNLMVHLKEELKVTVGKKDEIITIEYDSAFPDEAAHFVNCMVDAYTEYTAANNQTSATEVLKILKAEKDKQDKLLNDQMIAMSKFKVENPEMAFKTKDGMNIATQALASVSDQLTKARLAAASYYVLYLNGSAKQVNYQYWQDSLKQVEEFERLYEQQKTVATEVNKKEAEFAKLSLDVERTIKMADLIDTRIKELNVDEQKGAMNVQILENAKTEDVPSHPRKALIVAAAMVLGVLVGSGFACMHDWMDQRIRSADEVTEIIGLPVLGMVPTMLETDAAARANSGRKVHLDSGSDISEAYRTLRTAIFFGMPEKKVKTILFTSPQPGDGKSTSVSNLAIAMAQAGQRTLLIDCDLRKPVQHKTYSASNDVGISNVVARGVPVDEAIQRTEVEGLSLLPCGSMPPNPAEILNSAAFADVLHKLEQKFDIVLIDSPPVLPVTDARILSAIADMTILVLRAEKSTRKGAMHASDCLLNVGGKLFGAVVNDVPRKRGGYGYYAGYGYGGYGYGGYGDYRGGYGSNVVVSPMANGNGHHAEKKALTFSRVDD